MVDRAGFEPATSAIFCCHAKAAYTLTTLNEDVIHARLNYRPILV